ncbi:MAG: hypothetical protein ACREQ9_11770, partial [Candidatus Binatia bacterium]
VEVSGPPRAFLRASDLIVVPCFCDHPGIFRLTGSLPSRAQACRFGSLLMDVRHPMRPHRAPPLAAVRRARDVLSTPVLALMLVAALLSHGCSGSVADRHPDGDGAHATAANAAEDSPPPAEGGLPRWAWITIGATVTVIAATAILLAVAANNADDDGFFGDDFPCGENAENCGGDPVPEAAGARAR